MIQVADDKIIVQRSPPPTHHGDIELPSGSAGAFNYGVVLGVGPNVTNCKVGDVVVFEAVAASPIARTGDPRVDAENLTIYMWPRNILLVMTREAAEAEGLSLPRESDLLTVASYALRRRVLRAINPAMV